MKITLEDALDMLLDDEPIDDLRAFLDSMFEYWIEGTIFDGEEASKRHFQKRLIIDILKTLKDDQSRKTKCVPSDTGNADAHNSESN